MRIDIIFPVFNEAAHIERALQKLQPLRQRGARVIVVDGGSHDDTLRRAAPWCDRSFVSGRSRASCMNAGARDAIAHSQADVLLFHHMDTQLPPNSTRLIARALGDSSRLWGRFDLCANNDSFLSALFTAAMNLYSRLSGISSARQAIFVERGAWLALQGFAPIGAMEDVEFCRRARTLSRPAVPAAKALSTVFMDEPANLWRDLVDRCTQRLAFFLGADPDELARRKRR